MTEITNDIDGILDSIEKNDDEFIKDIKKYWENSTGIAKIDNAVREPLKTLQKQMPNVPMDEWESFIDEYNIPAMEGDFINQFMTRFTHEELKELLKLYEEHPLFKKLKESNKEIAAESYKLNEKWMRKFNFLLGEKVREWQSMGYLPPMGGPEMM